MVDLENQKMAKDKRRLLLITAILAVALPAAAQDWVELFEDGAGNVWYLNQRSIEDHDSYVMGWVTTVLSDSTKSIIEDLQKIESFFNREISYMVILWGAQKESRQVKRFQMAFYDMNDYPIVSITAQQLQQSGRGQWEYCIPDSNSEAVWEALMQAAGYR